MKTIRISIVLAFGWLAAAAPAATYTWTGNGGTDKWSNQQNWSPTNGVPGPGDSASIGSTNGSGFEISISAPVTLANLTVYNSILNLSASANPLTVSGSLQVQYATFQGNGGLVVNGPMTVDIANYVWNATTFNGPVTLNGSSTINSNVVIFVGPNVTLVNNGTFTLANTASVNLNASGGALFVNQGSFVGGNSSVTTSSSVFSNAPTGFIGTTTGSKLQFQGNLANNGAFVPTGGGLILVTALTALHNGTQFGGTGGITELGGTTTLDGQVTVAGSLQLGDTINQLPRLTMNGLLEVQTGGSLNWQGGTIQGVGTNVTGTLQIDSGGTMAVNQIASLNLLNTVVTNSGIVTIDGGGIITFGYNARIDNSGNFNFLSDGNFNRLCAGGAGYNVATFNNSGTIDKKGGTNSTIISFPVNSVGFKSGVIQADQGTVQLSAGGTIYGMRGIGQVKLSGGTFSTAFGAFFGSKTNLVVYLNGAVLNLDYSLTVNCTFQENPGSTITGPSNLGVQGGSFIWAGGTIALTYSNAAVVIYGYLGGQMTITGGGIVKQFKSGTLENYGTASWVGDNSGGGIQAGDGVVFYNGPSLNGSSGTWNCLCDAGISDVSTNRPPVFTNAPGAYVTKNTSAGTSYFTLPFRNAGNLLIESGTIELLSCDDSPIGSFQSPQVELLNGAQLKVDRYVTYHANISGRGQLTSGQGATIKGQLSADSITINGNTTNDASTVAGDAPGIITFAGNNFAQTTNGTLTIPIRGTNAATPDFGQLKVTGYGQIMLAGTLQVQITDGYAPPVGATFPFLTSFQRNGTFNNVILPPGMQLNYTAGGATLVVTGTVPVQIISPAVTNGQFQFGFNTISNRSYTVQYKGNLATGTWTFLTNFTGNGSYWQPPPLSPLVAQRFYRVSNP